MIVLREGNFFGDVQACMRDRGVTACLTVYHPGDKQADARHYHDHIQIYFTLNGGSIEKRNGGEKELKAGSINFYQAGEPHQNIRKGIFSRGLNIELEDSFLKQHRLDTAVISQAINNTPDVQFAAIKIYKELLAADQYTTESIQLLLLASLSPTRKNLFYNIPPVWVERVRQVLHDCWNEHVPLSELAAIGGVHPITISKHFPRYFACTLGEYMRKLKTEKALSMIRSGENSLTGIAFACGFADQSHFIRVFKQHTGLLPGQYLSLIS
jgi:AraC family transcriptional regulator